MEILYLILFSLPVLIAYLYLNRYIKKKGDTSLKSITFRIAIWIHGIALLLTIFSAILFYKEIIIRWGISWYIVYMTILSGITIYLTVSKKTAHYLWWKLYSGIYYWGVAISIPFWFVIMFFVFFIFHANPIFKNRQFCIYDTSSGNIHPKYHNNIIYKNKGLFLKELTSFEYDGMVWEIHDVETNDENTIYVHLKEIRTDSLEIAKDSILTTKTDD
ncbi:hypothetical protein [Bacteroides faecium]|uniref:Uncharacterized protein n=1 Tax=Bacteroides faecium TaxID=2715212 RepID=A0A6H0KW76_9BACE|nr:hypothetical protein [Bacteroides faecium]QIU96707.1 hypothetical protein BacF7301_22280 [Bacteroides faecium]